jgi:hypothetical protein
MSRRAPIAPDAVRRGLLVVAAAAALTSRPAAATDHNEPDLLSGFFNDRDGSGADIYGVTAYPSADHRFLNFAFTLAPVPETGRFDPNSVQRIYFMPATRHAIFDADLAKLKQLREGILVELTTHGITKKWRSDVIEYIDTFADKVLDPVRAAITPAIRQALATDQMPPDQRLFPEIRLQYSRDGGWARVVLRNFADGAPGTDKLQRLSDNEVFVDLKSSGDAAEPPPDSVLETGGADGLKVFVGGRDDDFYADIGGFFRSINWLGAVSTYVDPKDQGNFVWNSGSASWTDSTARKETNDVPKRLVDRGRKVGMYNGHDWRIGNNVNAVVMQIPMTMFALAKDQDQLRIWAESFLVDEAFKRINCPKGMKSC